MRPTDLARPYGLSSQAVRNYEQRGIIPRAARTVGAHRRYDERHRAALAAFMSLVPAVGHARAADLVRLAHQAEIDELLEGLDGAHAQLAADRATLDLVTRAVRELGSASRSGSDQASAVRTRPDVGLVSEVLPIGALAHQLGVRPSTLRAWEVAGIIRPDRDPRTGHRVYRAEVVRDARLAHQLRRGGYLLAQISTVVSELRDQHRHHHLDRAVADWHDALRGRGLALLRGTAALHELIANQAGEQSPVGPGRPQS